LLDSSGAFVLISEDGMANRRMFAKTITNSSSFLMMPLTSQALYLHLGMNADDDGFVEYYGIVRLCGAAGDDLKVLQTKNFVKVFDEMVLIITDWHEHNYIQSDRYTPSKYLDVYTMDTQVRLGKERKELVKDNVSYKNKYNISLEEEKRNERIEQDKMDMSDVDKEIERFKEKYK